MRFDYKDKRSEYFMCGRHIYIYLPHLLKLNAHPYCGLLNCKKYTDMF